MLNFVRKQRLCIDCAGYLFGRSCSKPKYSSADLCDLRLDSASANTHYSILVALTGDEFEEPPLVFKNIGGVPERMRPGRIAYSPYGC